MVGFDSPDDMVTNRNVLESDTSDMCPSISSGVSVSYSGSEEYIVVNVHTEDVVVVRGDLNKSSLYLFPGSSFGVVEACASSVVDIVAAVNTPNSSGVTDIDVHESASYLLPGAALLSEVDIVSAVDSPDDGIGSTTAFELLKSS